MKLQCANIMTGQKSSFVLMFCLIVTFNYPPFLGSKLSNSNSDATVDRTAVISDDKELLVDQVTGNT